ncbi:hypothetical protein K438DRAFT_1966369 [Mycena galopus ATCC 62051]|nr:hypothetical protein K438DRAFT_1966369 [Mycena galopus ATCC 62051]
MVALARLPQLTNWDYESAANNKKLLKKLRHDKSLVQGQLNALVDPVARLPLEISSEIFLQSATPPWSTLCPYAELLLDICNAWTVIALSTPTLWSSIQIVSPCAKGLTQILPIWFRRAHNRPLSISLSGDLTKFTDLFSTVLWRHAGQRLKYLEIADVDFDYEISFRDNIDLFDPDETTGPLPLLETLKIRVLTERGFSASQILRLLSQAPNTVECVFEQMGDVRSPFGMPEQLVLPTLRRLVFGESAPDIDSGSTYPLILSFLTLPALEYLSVPIRDSFFPHSLALFFEQSSPPLQELLLDVNRRNYMNFVQLRACLDLIPTLVRFEIWGADEQLEADLFTALGNSRALSLLPNLRHFTILPSRHISDSSWPLLLRAALAR